MNRRATGSDIEPRRGLGNAATMLSRRIGRIAYLGNSVTAQREGFRPLLHERLTAHFGQPHRLINAGLGGVGSLASLFTMEDLVLRFAPDLCFIECTTGDMGVRTPVTTIGPILE